MTTRDTESDSSTQRVTVGNRGSLGASVTEGEYLPAVATVYHWDWSPPTPLPRHEPVSHPPCLSRLCSTLCLQVFQERHCSNKTHSAPLQQHNILSTTAATQHTSPPVPTPTHSATQYPRFYTVSCTILTPTHSAAQKLSCTSSLCA